MQGDLGSVLPAIITQLRQLQSTLQQMPLQPASLEWESYLDQTRTLSQQFRSLIRAIPPEFRHFVAYPTYPDAPHPDLPIQTLLLTSTPELTSESALCKQRYREQIEQMGLSEMPPDDRERILFEQVQSHNRLCEVGVKRIQQAIEKNRLKEVQEPHRPPPPPKRKPETDLLMHLVNGRDLPVPANLR
jgi:hypothetical protein